MTLNDTQQHSIILNTTQYQYYYHPLPLLFLSPPYIPIISVLTEHCIQINQIRIRKRPLCKPPQRWRHHRTRRKHVIGDYARGHVVAAKDDALLAEESVEDEHDAVFAFCCWLGEFADQFN